MLRGGHVVDFGRTGMFHGVTEQSEFILAQNGVQLGPLGGTQKPAKRSFRAVSVKEQHARDAMKTLLRWRPAVDAAFGADPLAVPPTMLAIEDGLPSDDPVLDELVSDTEPALTPLTCSVCGTIAFVTPELAAALAGSCTVFSCAFQRPGGCVSVLRRRKR